jgi:hypothetical protein
VNADTIIELAELCAKQQYADPRDRLAFQVGLLQGEIHELCWQLEDASHANLLDALRRICDAESLSEARDIADEAVSSCGEKA